jgi:hypothetical protein
MIKDGQLRQPPRRIKVKSHAIAVETTAEIVIEMVKPREIRVAIVDQRSMRIASVGRVSHVGFVNVLVTRPIIVGGHADHV